MNVDNSFEIILNTASYYTSLIECLFVVKVKKLREMYKSLDIEVDGGVGLSTIDAVAEVRQMLIWFGY